MNTRVESNTAPQKTVIQQQKVRQTHKNRSFIRPNAAQKAVYLNSLTKDYRSFLLFARVLLFSNELNLFTPNAVAALPHFAASQD